MSVQRVFHATRGRFTVGIRVNDDGVVTASRVLCNENDQFVRKVGYQKADGLLNAKHKKHTARVQTLGRVSTDLLKGSDSWDRLNDEVFRPVFSQLEKLNTLSFVYVSDRVDTLTFVLDSALQNALVS